MANLTAEHIAVRNLIKEFGSSCVVTKPTGETKSATGVVMSGQSGPAGDGNGYVSNTEKICYLPGNIAVTIEEGDTITFKPNIYAVNDVKAIAVGEGKKNIFAYRCVLGTS